MKLGTYVVIGVASLALVACEEKEEGNAIGPAQSQIAGGALADSVESGAIQFQGTNPAAGFTCHSVAGDASDPDQDSIPTDVTVTYANCSQSGEGVIVTLNGQQSVKDLNNTAASFDFSLASDITIGVMSTAGGSIMANEDFTLTGSQPAGGYQIDVNGSRSVDAAGDGNTFQYDEDVAWAENYTPGSAWAPGDPLVAGSYTVNGQWSVAVDFNQENASANADVQTVTPLSLDPACESLVTAGKISASYEGPDGSRSLTVEWTACGSHTVTYQGAPGA